MQYRLADVKNAFECTVSGRTSDGGYKLEIDGKKRTLQVLAVTANGMEFVLDGEYHSVKYLRAATTAVDMIVDGIPISLDMHSALDEIVYKNSGGSGSTASQNALASKIPGKVISIAVKEGDDVNAGDTICTLEAMKMQVAAKAAHAGKVTSIKVTVGASIAKGDIIAEIE